MCGCFTRLPKLRTHAYVYAPESQLNFIIILIVSESRLDMRSAQRRNVYTQD
jgi:hypothetical protein